MKISAVNNFKYSNYGFYSSVKPKQSPSFSSLKLKNDENNYSDTCFYRDADTLDCAATLLKKTFPKGTDILDFASSNGEEAISLYSLIDKSNGKYKIYCFDTSDRAVELGKKGIYTVFYPMSYDYLLLPEFSMLDDPNTMEIKSKFYSVMEETKKPSYEINDINYLCQLERSPYFKIKYYKLKDEHKDKIEINKGNINNIDKVLPNKKVGAVLFRNAMYIETGNSYANGFSFNEDLNINKKEIIEKIVDKVYEKLLPGGLFILGDIEKDHVYIADNHVNDKDKIFVSDYCTFIYKNSPLWEALSKDGRFEPVLYKNVDAPVILGKEQKVPTIWRKK